jgi:ubiquinone/menaquinone biosynthesis C-methylase UbiE
VSDFDSRADTWDDPKKVERAEAVAAAIRRAVPLDTTMRTLEYGAGTGLLSFCLRNELGFMVLADSSKGMRAVAAEKIAAARARNMRVVDLDLTRDPIPAERYDLIISMMTLHHVADTSRVLAAFRDMLEPGGWLCVADLDAEDGSFHEPGVNVHHGFDREALRKDLSAAGFTDIVVADCCRIARGEHAYSVFLASCRKQ